jgi:predicted dehydrogenase
MCWLIEGGAKVDAEVQVGVPRIGVLGSETLAREWAGALARSGAGQIAAVVGGREEAAALAADVGSPDAALVGGSMKDLLASELAGVVLTAPTVMHESLAAEAMDHGLAVFCRSPLGRSAAEASRIVEVARRSDRLLMTDCPLRGAPGARKVRELVGRGALGDVHTVELKFRMAARPGADERSSGGWLDEPMLAGGGCLLELGTPLLDLGLWVLGYPQVVGASGRVFAGGRPVCGRSGGREDGCADAEDAVAACVELASGASIRLSCAWGAHIGCDARVEAEFHGTRGGAALRTVGEGLDQWRAERFRGSATEAIGNESAAAGRCGAPCVVRWARCLAEGRSGYDAACERAVDVAGAIDRVYAGRGAGAR